MFAWCSGEGEAGGIMDDLAYAGLKRSIKERIGIDIDAYKGEQMRRRLENFVLQRAGGQPAAWLRTLPTDVTTLASMREMLTINVSEFFRDAPQFDRLERVVLPSLLKEKRALNIWSAACSNGQEPYSLAILLNEAKADAGSRILATDFDRTVLERARSGGAVRRTRRAQPECCATVDVFRAGGSWVPRDAFVAVAHPVPGAQPAE